MNDKEISEIRRRYRAEKSGISRIRGCYVNEKRTIISEFDQSLGLMSESEAEEVLTLLRKVLSGKVGTNLMDIAFSTAQVQSGAEHGLLMTLRESALGDDAAVHAFYEKVIGSLALEGNYMILLCHDSYDVFSYHKDGGRSEDSGEIFRYILCAICPVSMAKPALSYFVRDNCFRNITADSVVAPPALGFLFPAFDNRSTNLYGALYYTRDTSDSHEEFTDAVFRAGKLPMPAAAQQETFRNVLAESVGEACSLPVVRAVRALPNGTLTLNPDGTIADMSATTANAEESADAESAPTEQPVIPDTPILRSADETGSEKVRVYVETAWDGHQIQYRRVGKIEELVVDGQVYAEMPRARVNGAHMTATVAGMQLEAGAMGGSNIVTVNGKVVATTIRYI